MLPRIIDNKYNTNIMLSFTFYCYAECRYADCRGTDTKTLSGRLKTGINSIPV